MIFEKNGERYRAYANAFLELQNQKKPPVPGALDMGWENFILATLPGGVKVAMEIPRPSRGGAGVHKKLHSLIIGQRRRRVKCGIR